MNNDNNRALKRLIKQLDFSSEQYYDLYQEPTGTPRPPEDIGGEVWTNLTTVTADLAKLRNEFSRLRRGVEDLRSQQQQPPAAADSGALERVTEQLRNLEARLGNLPAGRPMQPPPQQGDEKVKRLLKDFLLVVDTVDRVFELMERQPEMINESLRVGLESLYKLITETLGRHGLKAIDLKPGDQFDPHHHLAMSTEANELLPNGSVSQVLTKGYLIGDMILRSAQVVVVRNNK